LQFSPLKEFRPPNLWALTKLTSSSQIDMSTWLASHPWAPQLASMVV